jgi:hypothetical protein
MAKRKIAESEEPHKKIKLTYDEQDTILVIIQISMEFFTVDGMLSLSQVCSSWRKLIDENDFTHWIFKWRQVFGNHQTISQSSTRFQNPKHLCVYVEKQSEEQYQHLIKKKYSKLSISERRKKRCAHGKEELYHFACSTTAPNAEDFLKATNNGKLLYFRFWLSCELFEAEIKYARLELFPLTCDPMYPVTLELQYVMGGMNASHYGLIATDAFGLIFYVNNDELPFFDESAMEKSIRALYGADLSVDQIKWLAYVFQFEESFFYDEEWDFDNEVIEEKLAFDWSNNNITVWNEGIRAEEEMYDEKMCEREEYDEGDEEY